MVSFVPLVEGECQDVVNQVFINCPMLLICWHKYLYSLTTVLFSTIECHYCNQTLEVLIVICNSVTLESELPSSQSKGTLVL